MSSAPLAHALEVQGSVTACHDPSRIVEYGGRFYAFSTAPNINVRSSADLVTWQWENRPFSYSSGQPPWMDAIATGDNMWAPDLIQAKGTSSPTYLLFYSRDLGSGTTEHAVSGLATSSAVTGPWTDKGSALLNVVVSQAYYRVIDPAPIFDAQGKLWLAVGSFGYADGNGYNNGGIRVFQLNPQTGALVTSGDTGTRIAGSWIEAPFIYAHGGYYYLFFNQDTCCSGLNSTYFIRVGRSTSVTGPYTDMDGNSLLTPTSGGSLFMGRQYDANFTGPDTAPVSQPNTGSVGREIGPGHTAIVAFSDGIERVSYHYYDGNTTNGEPTLGIKTVLWGADGWPRPGWELPEGTIAIGTRLNAESTTTTPLWLEGTTNGPALAKYTGSPSQLWDVHHVDLNRFTLTSRSSGRALAVSSTGAVSLVAASSTDTAQRWFIEQTNDMSFRLVNVSTGKAMELATSTASAGATPGTGTYGVNLSRQRWFLSPAGAYRIQSKLSKLYLTAGGTTATSTVVQQAAADDPKQQFWFIPQASGHTAIVNVKTGYSMAVASASKADGARVELEVDTNGDGQRWSPDILTDGSIRLVPKASNKALEVPNASTAAGTAVVQGRWLHVLNQQYSLELLPNVAAPITGGDADAGTGSDGGSSSSSSSASSAGSSTGGSFSSSSSASSSGAEAGSSSGGATGSSSGGEAGSSSGGATGSSSGASASGGGMGGDPNGAGGSTTNSRGGCSCRVPNGTPPGWGGLLALGPALAFVLRMRRPARRGARRG